MYRIFYSKRAKSTNDDFNWVVKLKDEIIFDQQAIDLQRKIEKSFENYIAEASEKSLNDRDRYLGKEKHCVNHKELQEFIKEKFDKLKYRKKENLEYLTKQNEKCICLIRDFHQMMDKLKEFGLKLEMTKLEDIVCQYLFGDVHLHIDEMKQVIHYFSMAKTFFDELQDYQEIMKQPVLESKRHKGIQEFLTSFISSQKKFNVDIPEVQAFINDYYDTQKLFEQIVGELSDRDLSEEKLNEFGRTLGEVQIQFKCLENYFVALQLHWIRKINLFLDRDRKIIWTFNQLQEELAEGYRILDLLISKNLLSLQNEIEEPNEIPKQIEKLKPSINQLEEWHIEIEAYLIKESQVVDIKSIPNIKYHGKFSLTEKLQEMKLLGLQNKQNEFSVRRPFQNYKEYVNQIKQKNCSRSKQQINQFNKKKQKSDKLRYSSFQLSKQRQEQKGLEKINSKSKKIKKPEEKKPQISMQKIKGVKVLEKKPSVQENPQAAPQPQLPKKQESVTEEMRWQKKNELQKIFKMNQYFSMKPGINIEQKAKAIENQIFGDLYNYRNQYELQIESIKTILRNVENLKYISRNIYKKDFTLEVIKLYQKEANILKKIESKIAEKKKEALESAKKETLQLSRVVSTQLEDNKEKKLFQRENYKTIIKEQQIKVREELKQIKKAKKQAEQSASPDILKKPKKQYSAEIIQPQTLILQPSSFSVPDEPLLYNPDGVVQDQVLESQKTKSTKKSNELQSIGKITIRMTKKIESKGKEKKVFSLERVSLKVLHEIQPELLTQVNEELLLSFPTDILSQFKIQGDLHSSAQQAIEYFNLCRKDPQFKYFIGIDVHTVNNLGWLYCPVLSISSDLHRLAQKLKFSKKCIGDKLFDSNCGISIMYNDSNVQKIFKQKVKWIVLNEQLSQESHKRTFCRDSSYLKELENYEILETLKPSLMFIIYTKDLNSLNNNILKKNLQVGGLKGRALNYSNVLKMPEFNKIIDEYKQKKKEQEVSDLTGRNQQFSDKFSDFQQSVEKILDKFEPISDDEDQKKGLPENKKEEAQTGDVEIHGLIMEIPNIMDLLNK